MSNETLERRIMRKLATEIERRLDDPESAAAMSAAEMEMVRKLVGDAGITLRDIQSGDWGTVTTEAMKTVMAEEGLPFNVDDMPADQFGNA